MVCSRMLTCFFQEIHHLTLTHPAFGQGGGEFFVRNRRNIHLDIDGVWMLWTQSGQIDYVAASYPGSLEK